MRILISGSSGFVGTVLASVLATAGHRVIRLVRRDSSPGGSTIPWDPGGGHLDPAALEGVEAVVNLAGENIGSGRWSRGKKSRILESRVRGTTLLSETLARIEHPPKTIISASATGFYGSRGAEILTEESTTGGTYLSEVARQWEGATRTAREAGIRVVLLRIGVVLHPQGGALAKMLPLFRWGLGGRIGAGDQYMSWIALEDLLGLIRHALVEDSLRGPVNAVAPHPVTNREFTAALADALGRPAFLAVPSMMLRLLLGEMAEETLLSSQRAVPRRAIESGYEYRFPDLQETLRHLLRGSGGP